MTTPRILDGPLDRLASLSLLAMAEADPEWLLAASDTLPASAIAWADQMIAARGRLAKRLGPQHHAILRQAPRWAPVFLHHRDGLVREAAMRMIDGPARSPFAVAAIGARLNDWAEPVRLAGAACAARVFPATPVETMAAAAFHLGPRLGGWGRMGRGRDLLDAAFGRSDVTARLASRLMEQRHGASPLAGHLRTPALDGHLLAIARSATLPGVRRLALRTLLQATARWRVGRERRWTDKSQGTFHFVPTFATRAVELPCGYAELVAIGLADPAIDVQRMTLDAVMTAHPERVPPELISEAVVARLAAGRSPSLRQRADFLVRQRGG